MATLAKTTVEGWIPEVGALVWLQLWNPTGPHIAATIQERIATGVTYGRRRLMRVHRVSSCTGGCHHAQDSGVLHFYLRHPGARFNTDPSSCEGLFPTNGVEGPSWCESDWAVLEDASAEEGALF